MVTSEIDGTTYAVVSVNAMQDVDPARLARAPVSFDGEDVAQRLQRRVRGWIPKVRFEFGTGDALPVVPVLER